jgi:hypothetical protein
MWGMPWHRRRREAEIRDAPPCIRRTLPWVIFRRPGPLSLTLMTTAHENLAVIGVGVVLALLYPGVGLADSLLAIPWWIA